MLKVGFSVVLVVYCCCFWVACIWLWLLIGWVWVVCGFACCLAVAVGFVILLSVLVLVLGDVARYLGCFI